jgi:hypothetical protein
MEKLCLSFAKAKEDILSIAVFNEDVYSLLRGKLKYVIYSKKNVEH